MIRVGASIWPSTALASWARDQQTPLLYGSDVDQKVGKAYGAVSGKLDDRSLFVDSHGATLSRLVRPVSLSAGYLRAEDERTETLHTFALHRITAAVTRDAVDELGLAPGVPATAAVKATSVMVDRRDE